MRTSSLAPVAATRLRCRSATLQGFYDASYDLTVKSHSYNCVFVRPLWLGFAIAPPVTAFAYIGIQILLSVFGLVDYQGAPDEEYYIREPAIIAISFVSLSIVSCVTALLCGLPLIYILKRYRRLSSLSLILGATILGSVAVPAGLAVADVLLGGKVSNWGGALTWAISVGAASGCFTAFVFRVIVGIKER